MFYISINGKLIYKPLDDLLVLFNPKVTLEIGKAGSLEFDIPPVNPFYDKLDQLTTEIEVDMDNEEIFHGRVLSNERTFSNLRHVYCEGDLSYLIDSVQKAVQYSGTTHDLFNRIIANHNSRVEASKRFTVGTVNIENRNIVLVGQSENDSINTGPIDYKQIAIDSIVDNWNNTFDYIQTCLIDYCGGYLRTRRVNGTNYIDLLSDFNSESVQPIELGKNLLDLTAEISVEDLFTVLIPLGDDNLTIASVNGGSDELVDEEAVAKYGRIVRTHAFNNVTSASTLLENARRFMASNVNVPRTISVRAIDLHLINKSINPIKIGDKVEITSYVHEVNDVLTCTKIEYDLEHPENNNYVFGNEKQTLTQRYREDARHESDTYGNSSAITPSAAQSIGKASAASAGAIGAAALQEQQKAMDVFYDTWIKDGEEPGKVSLGALYRQFYEGKEVLISQCGIDLDGKTGNININSLHNQVNELGQTVATNTGRIDVLQTDTSVAIQSVTERIDSIGDREATHYTEITQQSDQLGSSITSLARDINEFEEGVTTSLASITQRADDQESRITATASYVSQVEGSTNEKIAAITAWANAKESVIEMKADRVYVDGKFEAAVASVDDLTSGRTTASKLRATDILAGSISLFSEGGAVPVASMRHSHEFTFIEQTNGDITLSLAGATNTIPQQNSFNIADTKYYKDNVSAVKLESLAYYELSGEQTVTYNADTKTLNASVQATLSNGNENGSIRTVSIPADLAYEAGFEDGGGSSSEVYTTGIAYYRVSGEDTVTYNANAKTLNASVQATLSNNNARGSVRTVTIPADLAYDAGFTDGSESGSGDVYTTGIAYYTVSGEDTVSYDSDNKILRASVQATLSNGNTNGSIRTVSIPATLAYNAGKADAESGAASEVYTTGISYYSVSGEQTVSYNADTTTLSASVQATLSNGNTRGSVRTVTIPAGLAVQAGIDAVSIKTLGFYSGWSEDSRGYLYETANKRFKVRVKGTLSDNANNRVYGATVYLPATEAYEAGYADGAESGSGDVYTTGIAYYTVSGEQTVSYNSSSKTLSASVQATLSNGNTRGSVRTVTIPANLAYEAGKADGSSSTVIESVTIDRNGSQDWYDGGGYWALPIKVVVKPEGGSSQRYVGSVNIMDVVNASSGNVGITSVNYYSGPTNGPYGSKRMYVTVYLSNGVSEVRYFDYAG